MWLILLLKFLMRFIATIVFVALNELCSILCVVKRVIILRIRLSRKDAENEENVL